MAKAIYIPYKGVFGGAESITTTLEWFNDASELVFLWVFPDGKGTQKVYTTATNAGSVTVSGTTVTISSIQDEAGESAIEVFVYRRSAVSTRAVEDSEMIPLKAMLTELEELYLAVEDVRIEVDKAIRMPEWENTEPHLMAREFRKGKAMGFDALGNPVCGILNIPELSDYLTLLNTLKDDLRNTHKQLTEQLDAHYEGLKGDLDKIKADTQSIHDATQNLHDAAEDFRDQCGDLLVEVGKLHTNTQLVLVECERILASIKKYEYRVVTREAYETLVESGNTEANVIYFVRGTVDVGKLVLEWLEKGVGETPQNLENFQTFIIEKVTNDIKDLEASTAEELLNRPTKIEVESAISESEERTNEKIDEALGSILSDIGSLTVATTEQAGVSKLGTGFVAEDGSAPVGVDENGRLCIPSIPEHMAALFKPASDGEVIGMARLGKALLACNDGDNGGYYAGGSATTARNWTQWLTRYQWNRIRAYGNTNGIYEDFYLVPGGDGENTRNVIARKKDLISAVLESPVLIDGKAGVVGKVLCPAISNQANTYGYYGTLGNLGCSSDNVFLTELSFYKRGNHNGNNVSTPLYLRVLRVVDGEWEIACESSNTITASSFAEGDAMTWQMTSHDTRGPISSTENIAIVFVTSTSHIASTSVSFGCKTSSIAGALLSAIPSSATTAPSVATGFAPAIDVAFCTTIPLVKTSDLDNYVPKSDYDVLLARVEALEAAQNTTEG